MRSHSHVLLVVLSALLLASVIAVPGQSGAAAVARPDSATARGSPPSLLAFTAPYTYYFPFVGQSSSVSLYGATVYQGASTERYGVTIQNRSAVVRAFVLTSGGGVVPGVNARMFVMNGSTTVGTVDSPTVTISGPSVVSNMSSTLNFDVPAGLVQSGNSYYIVLDPNNVLPPQAKGTARYPAAGTVALNANYAPVLQVVIIPINYLPYGDSTSYWPALNYANYLESMPQKILPVPSVTYITTHPGIFYIPSGPSENLDESINGLGWQALLSQVTQVHNNDLYNPTWSTIAQQSVYYGVVNIATPHNGCTNCYTGLGWIGNHSILATAVGWSGDPDGSAIASETMTHEMGHNFGREHVACSGLEDNPDLAYPYPGGKIGVWGMDMDSHQLKDPTVTADFMSYCSSVWTSDYTFMGIKAFRDSGSYQPVQVAASQADAFYVSGLISKSDQASFRPVYRAKAPLSNLNEGTHVVDVMGSAGNILASYRFTPARIADSDGGSGFGFFIPANDQAAGLRVRRDSRVLGEKTVTALPTVANFRAQAPSARREASGTVLRWAAVTHPTEPVRYTIRISHDAGATWQVLALDLAKAELTVPAGADLSNSLVEIQASDGIHVVTQTVNIGQIP